MQDYISQKQINEIFDIAIKAGEIAKSAFLLKNFKVFDKIDKSKLSSVDLEVSDFIFESLNKIFPQIPIICEERKLRVFDGDLFFLIDPIDGTSSFISDSNEFCINISLISNQRPIFGMIYAPLFEGGKMMINNSSNQVVVFNYSSRKSQILENLYFDFQNNLKIITSTRTKEEDIKNYIQQYFPQYLLNFEIEKLSSAIKFFRIIEGKANLYLHLRQSMEWDTASGHALINSLGKKLITLNYDNKIFNLGNELQYKKNNFINSGFVITDNIAT